MRITALWQQNQERNEKVYTFKNKSIRYYHSFCGILNDIAGNLKQILFIKRQCLLWKNGNKNGRYIERDIAREQLIGKYYTEKNGTVKYGPYCDENALSSVQTYIVAVNDDCNYYIPLIIPRRYQKNFKKMIDGDVTFHMLGKFKKSDYILNYDIIASCTGIDSKTEIDQMVSPEYQIEIISLKDEKKILYKGLSLLILGVLTLSAYFKRKI